VTAIEANPVVEPVPARLTVCGLLLALSVMLTAPVADPVFAGLKVTEMVHFCRGATVLPQVFVWANGTVLVMPLIVNGALPLLIRVTFLTALVVPTTTLPKFRLAGERVTAGALAAAASDKSARPGNKIAALSLLSDPRLASLSRLIANIIGNSRDRTDREHITGYREIQL
jgi:hypothetical protein